MVVDNVGNSMQPCKTWCENPEQGLRKCHSTSVSCQYLMSPYYVPLHYALW